MRDDVVVLDTDVASALVKRRTPPTLLSALASRAPCVTLVTVAELTEWEIVRSWGGRTVRELRRWLDNVAVLSWDVEVATMWGRLSAESRRAGRPAPQNDTWIAASCLMLGFPLATLNTKDYAYYAEHHGLRLLPTSS